MLPVSSKIIERLVYNRLLKYINDSNLLYKYQFGFQMEGSTHVALFILIDKISEALEDDDCVIWIFLDNSKAFDTVDHIILLQKMYLYQGPACLYCLQMTLICFYWKESKHNGNSKQ